MSAHHPKNPCFQIPDDFLGLRNVVLHISDHSVEPVTVIEVMEVQVADLLDACSHTPRLTTAVLFSLSESACCSVSGMFMD